MLKVSDIPGGWQNAIKANGICVQLTMQRTGFGHRRYFLCPSCDRKCGKLHFQNEWLYCQKCTPQDIYKYRRGLYDEGGERLIMWHMNKLIKSISNKPIKWPFHYHDYLFGKPQGMSGRKFRNTLMKLQIMENMRFEVIFAGRRFKATHIKGFTNNIKESKSLWIIYQSTIIRILVH